MRFTRPHKRYEHHWPRAGAVTDARRCVKSGFTPLEDPSRQGTQGKGEMAILHHRFRRARPESSVRDTDPVAPGVLGFIGGSVCSLSQRDQRLTNVA